LRAGRPLTELTAGLPSAHIDQWRVRLDGIAREVRDFMSQTGLSHWRASPQSSVPADPLPSLQGDNAVEEELSLIGLPVPPTCEKLLQRVAYAPTVSASSPWASEVRMQEDVWRRCLRWSTRFAPHEATPLCAECPSSGLSKTSEQVVEEACRKDECNKRSLDRLRDQIDRASSSLKCHMACNAMAEASATLVRDALARVEDVQTRLSSLHRGAADAGLMASDMASSPQATELFEALELTTSSLQLLAQTAEYSDHASKAGTDAAARGIRGAVQHCRAETVRIVLGQKDSAESAAQRASQALPVVPSSLFGGRWFGALDSLHQHRESRQQLQQLVKQSAGGALVSVGSKAPKKRPQPFRSAPGGSQPPGKKAKVSGAHGATAADASSSTKPSSGRPKNHPKNRGKGRGKSKRGGGEGGAKGRQ